MKADGILGEDGLFRITLPAHAGVVRRDHSWRHDWIKSVCSARDRIEANSWEIIVPVDFATGHPNHVGPEGAVVIKSYESGGEILRVKNGAWIVAGHQPEVVH